MRTTAAVLVLCGALTACGGAEAETAAPADPKPSATTAPPEPVKDPGCEPVQAALLTALAAGAEADVGALTLTNGRAYRSPDYASVYFIAADLTAPGVNDETGVWATNSLGDGGVYLAVDGFAKQFTAWPDADSTDAAIGGADPGVDKARGCVL